MLKMQADSGFVLYSRERIIAILTINGSAWTSLAEQYVVRPAPSQYAYRFRETLHFSGAVPNPHIRIQLHRPICIRPDEQSYTASDVGPSMA